MDKFKKVYLNWNGRICRKTYWIYSIPLALISIPYLVASNSEELNLYDLIPLLIVYPAMMINIKRAHDRNRTGWFTLILFIPIVSLWPLIELGFLKGNEVANKYGEPDDIWNT